MKEAETMDEGRQRLTAKRKFQVYLETRVPGANVGEILRRFGLHVNDLRRIEAAVEGAAVEALRGKRSGHVAPDGVSAEEHAELVKELQEKEHALAQLMVEYTLLKKTYSLGTAAASSKGFTSRASGAGR
jgi:transposase-like protein